LFIHTLEDTLDTKLIKRKGRGLILTPEGVDSLPELTEAMLLLTASVEKMRKKTNQKQLIVTVEASFATAWLVPRLAYFKQLHPEINVLIESSQHIIDLHRSDIDIAIRYGVHRDDSLLSNNIFEDKIFPACSPALANGPPRLTKLEMVHLEQLAFIV